MAHDPDSSGLIIEHISDKTGDLVVIGGVLSNQTTGKPEQWPYVGIRLGHIPADVAPGDRGKYKMGVPPPKNTGTSEREIQKGILAGYITLEGQGKRACPSGPPSAPWAGGLPSGENQECVTAEFIVFDTVDGPIRFKVTRNPGKYYYDTGQCVNDDMSRYGDTHEVESPKGKGTQTVSVCQVFHDFRMTRVA